MTVEELKAEAAKLPASDRFALAEWIVLSEDVRTLQDEQLIDEIQQGLVDAEGGELHDGEEVFAGLRDAVRTPH